MYSATDIVEDMAIHTMSMKMVKDLLLSRICFWICSAISAYACWALWICSA